MGHTIMNMNIVEKNISTDVLKEQIVHNCNIVAVAVEDIKYAVSVLRCKVKQSDPEMFKSSVVAQALLNDINGSLADIADKFVENPRKVN